MSHFVWHCCRWRFVSLTDGVNTLVNIQMIFFNEQVGLEVRLYTFQGARPGHRLSWLRFLWFSSAPSGKCQDSNLVTRIGHDRILPNSLLMLMLYHSTNGPFPVYNVTDLTGSVNRPMRVDDEKQTLLVTLLQPSDAYDRLRLSVGFTVGYSVNGAWTPHSYR
jgi:hypothetical protein